MLLEKDSPEKRNTANLVIGYDLSDEFSQISYHFAGQQEPETISTVTGGESYNIPSVLAKREGVNQWFYGKEALREIQENHALGVTNLMSLARRKEMVELDGEEFDPTAILALFMRRTMSLLSLVAPVDKIDVFVVTVDELDKDMIEILNHAVAGIGLKTNKIYFQSHTESFYYYMIAQPKELWNHQVLLYDFSDSYMKTYRMECNNHTTPIVAFIEKKEYPEMTRERLPQEEYERDVIARDMDAKFEKIVSDSLAGNIVSGAYLIGDGFQGDWAKQSLKELCRNRRAFQGNNLYSKGACYGAMEKMNPSETGKAYVFLGNEKLKANIGMKVLRQGEESYLALLDAGVNWFESVKECDFILEKGNSFSILITPLNGKQIRELEIQLEGVLERPERTTRVHMKIYMNGEHQVAVELTDMGFGELFPATGHVFTEEFEI